MKTYKNFNRAESRYIEMIAKGTQVGYDRVARKWMTIACAPAAVFTVYCLIASKLKDTEDDWADEDSSKGFSVEFGTKED